ncbi:MAG TPA: NCS2 family permease [Alphaproteobacteria bacterium]|jgi:AGZA family xanthine/uracil permease-like MFS transporter|nr:NCS2 family permease [Alphaproteobacteria bacterium]
MDRFFGITEQGSTVRTELVAGVTTFLTMAYIMFVNPLILADAGMDKGAVFVATCLASAFATLIMALYANYPIALAPGMGINAFFTYGVVLGMHYSWQAALGAVFVSGILFLILSVTPLREWIVGGIPKSQKMAIAAGIGLFLGILALKGAGVIAADKETYVTLGNLRAPAAILAAVGFIVMVALEARRVPGAILIAVLGVTAAGILAGISPFGGVVSLPPSLAPTFLALDLRSAFSLGAITVILAFFFVDLFDSTGTLIGVAHQAGLLKPDGTLPRLRKVLLADSLSVLAGAAVGTSPVTSYIESAAGVKAGGRTGLVGVTVAVLFLASLFLAPLAGSVPPYATAPALLFVACLMTRGLTEIDWDDATEYAPAIVTALAMPLTFSISNGIALGFIAYAGVKLLSGRVREIGWPMAILAVLFVAHYWVG